MSLGCEQVRGILYFFPFSLQCSDTVGCRKFGVGLSVVAIGWSFACLIAPVVAIISSIILSSISSVDRATERTALKGKTQGMEWHAWMNTHTETRRDTKPMKKSSDETQALCAGCSKAGPKIFAPPQTHFPGARDGQNLISWRWSLPLPTNPVWWGSMHAISSYRGNRPTNTHTHKQTQIGPITIHCAAASAQCN